MLLESESESLVFLVNGYKKKKKKIQNPVIMWACFVVVRRNICLDD